MAMRPLSPRRSFLGRHTGAIQLGVDLVAWCIGLFVVLTIRYDFGNGWHESIRLARFLPLVLIAQLFIGYHVGLYQRQWRFGSFEEVKALAATATVTAALVTIIDALYLDHLVPVSVPVGAGFIALVGMLGPRYLWRMMIDRGLRPDPKDGSERIIVIGAGEGGAQVITALLRNPGSEFLPVALLDDDADKQRLRIMGVPVRGTIDDLEWVGAAVGAETVLLAVPSATSELVRRTTERCQQAGMKLFVLPQVGRLSGRTVQADDIHRPTAADLLGRREIDTDIASIAGYVTGRRVLVTGAGGSIGSELCRQLSRFGPAELVMLDRDESALHAVQLSIEGRALLDRPDLVVADIRDRGRLREVFTRWQPEVVFHAAALKHLPLLEMHPEEAVKTNILGTQHLLDTAVAFGVSHFVNISTDKAADPTSVLGYTKRIAERLTAEAAERSSEGTYLSVRFGNVLGSRGALLDSLLTQIDHGGPVTITHPEVTRYFMTIEEAVQLLVQAGAIGRSGQALVLDMGEPVSILDLAHQLIALAGHPVETVFTGLRPGEKLHEVLLGTGEVDVRPSHPLIAHVDVPPLRVAALTVLTGADASSMKLTLGELCATIDLTEADAPVHHNN